MVENSIILSNLIKNQREDINLDKKLSFKDLNRISYNLNTYIFTNECSIWNGYITNINSKKKNCYISFFFKNKKVSLHRLLFANYVEDINDNEYVKYICNNKGKCCTINHMKKTLKEDDQLNNDDNNLNNIDDNLYNYDDNLNNDDNNIDNQLNDNLNSDNQLNSNDNQLNSNDNQLNSNDNNLKKEDNITKNRVYF